MALFHGVRVEVDLRPLAAAIRELGQTTGNKVIARALNDAAKGVAITMKREVPKRASFTIGQVASMTRTIKAGPGSLVARVAVSDPRHPASYPNFKLSAGRVPSFAPWKRREGRPGAFVATMRSGHTSIFIRHGKRRLPIEDVGWGPSAARELARTDHGYNAPFLISQVAVARFAKEFERNYRAAVSGVKAKYGL